MGWFDSTLTFLSPGYRAYKLWQGWTGDEGPSRQEVIKYAGIAGGGVLTAYSLARGVGRFAEEMGKHAAENTSMAQGHTESD